MKLSPLLVQVARGSNDGFPVLYVASHGTDCGLSALRKQGGRRRSSVLRRFLAATAREADMGHGREAPWPRSVQLEPVRPT